MDAKDTKRTSYPGPSEAGLAAFPPKDRWDDWAELDPTAWPKRVLKHYALVPTTCFNCEAACGLLAYVDKETGRIRKFEGNPEHPASRGRNCSKGPATINQVHDPDRILHPLKRAGKRGENTWKRVSWEEALADIAARIRASIVARRPNEVMYHVGRPGEDGFTERVLAAWGVDGHNSHTNICSSSGRFGYHTWMGCDRPSPDHAGAELILLISAHLESGHYFNPHAQRILEAKRNGAKVVVLDVRLSNTATHADHWLAPYPGTEAAILLAVAGHLIRTRAYDRAFVRRWWNWEEYLAEKHPSRPRTFDTFEQVLAELYGGYSFAYAERESGVPAATLEEVARLVARAGTRLSTHVWRSATAGNLGGWQVARTLFLLNALTGAVATEGGTFPNAWNKFVPKPMYSPPHPHQWNELTWPEEYPLSMMELSILLPHLLQDGRGRLSVYFSRAYNPVWTNPDGFSWMEALLDEAKVGLHVALTPIWNETAYFADYVLPVGLAPERHDLHSYETHDGQWIGFRQPVLRAYAERQGRKITDTRQTNPGEVWEENELWIDLSWRIDPDGALGIRKYFESKQRPGEKLGVDEYYGWIFEHSVPGLPERARELGMTPLEYMRRHGVFEVSQKVGRKHEEPVPGAELLDARIAPGGRVYTRAPKPDSPNVVSQPTPDPDAEGRRPVGVALSDAVVRGFPTPTGRLEFWSRTIEEWGWPEHALPGYIKSHIHPDSLEPGELPLIPTFRIPVQCHTRSGNSKWLDEIAHSNPLWIHPGDAKKLGVALGDLVRVETRIGFFVVRAWVTEGIRPGVVACSHHMGRWKIGEVGQRQMMVTVRLGKGGTKWKLSRDKGIVPFASSDADTSRIWWTDGGVSQNLTFPVQVDPISGMHCWHQAVRVRKAEATDKYGDVSGDVERARAVYREWLEKTRPARQVSPDGTRRPYWIMRPLKPGREAYRLPERELAATGTGTRRG